MFIKTILKSILLLNLPLSIFAIKDCEDIKKEFKKKELEIDSCENNDNGEVIKLSLDSNVVLDQTDIEKISTLTNLEELEIALHSDLNTDSFVNLNKLSTLKIEFSYGAKMGDEIKENDKRINFKAPQSVKNLELSFFYEITPENINEISNLKNLEKLSVGTRKDDINFEPLKKLKKLSALKYYNPSGDLPESIYSLTQLKSLDLDDDEHVTLSDKIENLTNLEYLSASDTSIGQLPEFIGNLKNLRVLNLSSNHVTSTIPESWNSLEKLEKINLSLNYIKGKVLTNPSLKECIYGEDDLDDYKDLCKPIEDIPCLSNNTKIKLCEESTPKKTTTTKKTTTPKKTTTKKTTTPKKTTTNKTTTPKKTTTKKTTTPKKTTTKKTTTPKKTTTTKKTTTPKKITTTTKKTTTPKKTSTKKTTTLKKTTTKKTTTPKKTTTTKKTTTPKKTTTTKETTTPKKTSTKKTTTPKKTTTKKTTTPKKTTTKKTTTPKKTTTKKTTTPKKITTKKTTSLKKTSSKKTITVKKIITKIVTIKKANPTSMKGKCGKGFGNCPSGYCCSQYGWCGKTPEYCGKGCQSEFGKCKN